MMSSLLFCAFGVQEKYYMVDKNLGNGVLQPDITVYQTLEDYKNGKDKAIGFLVGQTMKAMKGKADPASVNALLRELLK